MIAFGAGPWWQWPVAGLGAAGSSSSSARCTSACATWRAWASATSSSRSAWACTSAPPSIPALFVGFLSGAVVGVAIMASRKGDAKTAIPFGPFLAAGAILALFFGQALIDAYLGLVFPDR